VVIRLLVDDRRIDLATDTVELKLSVNLVAEDVLQVVLRCSWVEPCVIVSRVENDRLPVMQVASLNLRVR